MKLKVNDTAASILYAARVKGLKQNVIAAELGVSTGSTCLAIHGRKFLGKLRKRIIVYINNYQPTKQ